MEQANKPTVLNDKAIDIQNLKFSYKYNPDIAVLKGINLSVEKGQFIMIMGPSQAGKSTLANCLNGLIPHFMRGEYQGDVRINQKSTKDYPVSKMAKEIGLVFQDFESQLFSTNTTLEIAFGPENFGVERSEIQKRIPQILSIIKLEGFENRHPATLSGGQKQRLAIGSVLATQPKIICMDEPTTDLDPLGKQQIFDIADELRKQSELSLVIIEHETEEALSADRLIFLFDGQIICDGDPGELLRDVAKMDDIGIMPLQITKFFSTFESIPKEQLPLTPNDGLKTFRELGLNINETAYQALVEKDGKREEMYGNSIISISDLKHVYPGGFQAINNINFDIREREFIAILGHNGSGKTTLAKHLNGLLTPTEGTVVVAGKNTQKSSIFEIGEDIGYVFQNPDHQIFADTVYEEVSFSPRIRGCSDEEIQSRVGEALKAVGLEGYEKEDPFCLTKGNRQRVAVASILSARPKVIILDEPTTGLDYKEQKKMMSLIKQLNENGHTIIMITHTMWVVSEYAHKVAVIDKGELVMFGPAREIFAREKELLNCHLKTPNIVSFSNQLGKTVLSIDELQSCVKEGT